MPRKDMTMVISGGEAFQRERLTSEVIALLESLHILVGVNALVVQVSDDEHQDQLQQMQHDVVVHVRREP